MSPANFKLALDLISVSNSAKISINVPVTDNYSNVHQILIHECNATLINVLVAAGFSLYMRDKGLSVDHLGV